MRIGIVGSGGMARRRGLAFAALDGCSVPAVAARNPETGAALARELGARRVGGWESLVEGDLVDAVAVCTHNDSHGAIALAAVAAGKPVFVEYPLARREAEVEALTRAGLDGGSVVRVAHGEVVSAGHRALREAAAGLGELMAAVFVRLTPGRGARPEVLLNLPVSGPPALFFVYQVYPLVDLFGSARWVEASCRYEGLEPATGRYRRFQNTVTAGLGGGTATWVWSGGVEIDEAEQFERLVMSGGTLVRAGGAWSVATPSGRKALAADEGSAESLEQLFLRDVRGEETGWQTDLATAADAARLGLRAERAMEERERSR